MQLLIFSHNLLIEGNEYKYIGISWITIPNSLMLFSDYIHSGMWYYLNWHLNKGCIISIDLREKGHIGYTTRYFHRRVTEHKASFASNRKQTHCAWRVPLETCGLYWPSLLIFTYLKIVRALKHHSTVGYDRQRISWQPSQEASNKMGAKSFQDMFDHVDSVSLQLSSLMQIDLHH